MSYTKPIVYKNMSKFQIACKPGHRPSEHLFVVKSVMALYNSLNKGLIFSSFDLRKFYDSEKLTDCMAALHSRQVKGKLYRLIFNMNKSVRITVKMPVGVTQSAEVGETVTQGSVEAATLSSNSIDKGLNVAFADSDGEISYCDVKLSPVSFMDDIGRFAETVRSAQDGNDRIVNMLESKLLDVNIDKPNYLLIGNKK